MPEENTSQHTLLSQGERSASRPPIFVPVALSENEAIALKSAAIVVFTSGPVRLSLDHPLFTGAKKIEDAWSLAIDKAQDEGKL